MPTLIGTDLNDQIIGSDGDDTISGLGGNDQLLGNAGNDTIDGGSGDDILTGGSGLDILTGGIGVDRFADTAAGLNGDRITDLLPGDRIQITDLTIQNAGIGVTGSTITYNGGSVTVDNLGPGRLIIREIQGGGVEIRLQSIAENDFNGDGRSDLLLRHSQWHGDRLAGAVERQLFQQSCSRDVRAQHDLAGGGHRRLQWRRTQRRAAAAAQWLLLRIGLARPTEASSVIMPLRVTRFQPDGILRTLATSTATAANDVLLRHDNGTVTDWLGQANGSFFSNHAIANYSPSRLACGRHGRLQWRRPR